MFLLSSQHLAKRLKKNSRGFGLIELMVSISIMAIIMAVVIARHDRFNGVILLRSQAYEIALQLREVQLSAVSATSRAGEYRANLGIYFDTTNPNRYTLFQDSETGTNANLRFDPGEEIGASGILDSRFEIKSIRYDNNSTNGATLQAASVVFRRPDFDASLQGTAGPVNTERIKVDVVRVGTSGTASDELRSVEITSTGQITVTDYEFN